MHVASGKRYRDPKYRGGPKGSGPDLECMGENIRGKPRGKYERPFINGECANRGRKKMSSDEDMWFLESITKGSR